MAEVASALVESSVDRINKLKDGYSWNVAVAAANSTIEALEEAKDRALLIVRQLEKDLNVQEPVEETEVPF